MTLVLVIDKIDVLLASVMQMANITTMDELHELPMITIPLSDCELWTATVDDAMESQETRKQRKVLSVFPPLHNNDCNFFSSSWNVEDFLSRLSNLSCDFKRNWKFSSWISDFLW